MIDDDTLPNGQPVYRPTVPEGATHFWAKGGTYYRLEAGSDRTTSRIWFWSEYLNKWLESENMPEYMLGEKLQNKHRAPP